METKSKIQKLWKYFGVQDNEILIVRSYNESKDKDEYIIAETNNGEFVITISDTFPQLMANQPFQIIQQRDSNGRFAIPSVEQIQQDETLDF